MIYIINIIVIVTVFLSLFGVAYFATKIMGHEDLGGISIRDFIFFKKWLSNKESKVKGNDKIIFRKRIFLLKFFMLLYITSVISLIVVTIFVIKNGISMRVSQFLVLDAFMILIFIFEPLINIIHKGLGKKVDEFISFMLHGFEKYVILHAMTFFVFLFSIVLGNSLLLELFNKSNSEHAGIEITLFTYLLSILIYHFGIIRFFEWLMRKTKYFGEVLEEFSMKGQTYLYITIIFIIYKFLILSGLKSLEGYFGIPIETIGIFFMIDVYIDKRKNKECLKA